MTQGGMVGQGQMVDRTDLMAPGTPGTLAVGLGQMPGLSCHLPVIQLCSGSFGGSGSSRDVKDSLVPLLLM